MATIRFRFRLLFMLLLMVLYWSGYAYASFHSSRLQHQFDEQQSQIESLRDQQSSRTDLLDDINAYRDALYALDLVLIAREDVISGFDEDNPYLVFDYNRVLDDLRRLLPKDARTTRFQVTPKGLLTLPIESVDYASLGRVLKRFKDSELFTEVYIPSGMQRVPKQIREGDTIRIENVYTFTLQAQLSPEFWQEFIPFPDVPLDAYYLQAVRDLVIAGSVTGYPDGLFRPDQPINRAEFFKIALFEGLSNGDLTIEQFEDFSDIGQAEWHYQYAQLAQQLGLTSIDANGRFYPDQFMTRLEAITMMQELFDVELLEDVNADLLPVAYQTLDDSIQRILATAIEDGLLDPFDDQFDPYANASRAEMTYFMWRLKMDYLQ